MRELLIIGAGGLGPVVASTADDINAAAKGPDNPASWEVIGYADGDGAKRGSLHAGRPVHGTLENVAHNFHGRELWFICAIGDNAARARMMRLAEGFKWKAATLVHPSAIVANPARIGAGSYLGPACVIAVNAKIGAHVFIDMQVSVGHDAELGDFSAVFSGARISGNCRVGEYALVGSNATLMPGTTIGARSVVGANSVAHGVIRPDTTIFGVPARVIRRDGNT